MLSLRELCVLAIRKRLEAGDNVDQILSLGDISYSKECTDDVLRVRSAHRLSILSLLIMCPLSIEILNLGDFYCSGFPVDLLLRIRIFNRLFCLQELQMGSLVVSNYGLSHLSMCCPNIIRLDLTKSRGFCCEGLRSLSALKYLESLNLSDCNIDIQDWPLVNITALKDIDIGGNSISIETFRSICEHHGDRLERFGIWGCSCLGNFNNEIFLLRATPTLKELDIRWVAPLSEHFFSLLRAFEQLETFRCTPYLSHGGYEVDSRSMECILYSTYISQLQDFSLQNISLLPDMFCGLSNLSSIRHLNLSGCTVYFSENCSLASLTTLLSLDLRECILHIPQQYARTLTEVYNGAVDVDDNGDQQRLTDDSGSEATDADTPIGRRRSSNQRKKSILQSIFPDGLRSLDVSNCSGAHCSIILSRGIQQLKNLRALHMRSILLPDWNFILENKMRLRSIDVTSTNVSAEALLTVIRKNRMKLESLHCSGLMVPSNQLASLLLDCTFPRIYSLTLPVDIVNSFEFNKYGELVFPSFSKSISSQNHISGVSTDSGKSASVGMSIDKRDMIRQYQKLRDILAQFPMPNNDLDSEDGALSSESDVVSGKISISDVLASREDICNNFRPPDLVHVSGLTIPTTVGLKVLRVEQSPLQSTGIGYRLNMDAK